MSEDRLQALVQLQNQMRVCRLCLEAGYSIYPRAIFSGQYGARLMIIGQAPGITEKDAGRPFNAGSGSRLFRWLEEAGVEETWFRSTQYMTSVTKCFPGRSKSGSGDRVPSRVEQALCRPYLDREIALVDPALIIPIGTLAIELFYPGRLPLEQVIGTQKTWESRWIVPLPHPSGASRWHQVPENRSLVEQAIALIARHITHLFHRVKEAQNAVVDELPPPTTAFKDPG